MQEERLMVLQMLQDGKITAEEAMELLKALEGSEGEEDSSGAGAGRRSDWRDQPEELRDQAAALGERLSGVVQEKVQAFVQELEKEQEQGGGRLFGWLDKLGEGGLERLLGLVGGHRYQFEEVQEGQLSGDPVRLDLRTFNGRIEVTGWEQAGYQLTLVKTVRGDNEPAAREVADQLMQVESLPDGLSIRPSREHASGAHGATLLLKVPEHLHYALELETSNGRIVLQQLNALHLRAKTANGRIEAQAIVAQSMRLVTANGRIVVAGRCPELEARTSNGRIVLHPAVGSAQLQLITSNGSISVILPEDANHGYALEASTSNSRISTNLPDLEFTVDERQKTGRKRLEARTRDYAARPEQVQISARTSNGHIFLGAGEED